MAHFYRRTVIASLGLPVVDPPLAGRAVRPFRDGCAGCHVATDAILSLLLVPKPSARIEVYSAGRGPEPRPLRSFVDPFPNLPQPEWRRRMLALSAPESDVTSLSADATSAPKPLDRTPTLMEFIQHAELYGTDCLYETAETYLARAELPRLQIEVDAVEAATKSRRFAARKRRRRPRRETQNAVRILAAEGFPTLEIAGKLGVRPETVLKYRGTASHS